MRGAIATTMAMMGMLAFVACNGDGGGGDDDTGSGIPNPDGGRECEVDHSPTFQLEAMAGEPQRYETDEGIKCLPTVVIRAINVEDLDGDLNFYKMDVWFDGTVDGRVLPEGTKSRVQQRVEGDDCEVDQLAGIGMSLGIAGGGTSSPAFETVTEFGVVVIDEAGNESYEGVPQVISVETPGPVTSDAECD